MKYIPLTTGGQTIVDDEDYDILSQFKWRADQQGDYTYIVRTTDKIRIHRLILKCNDSILVGHRNHDTFDNRKINLRKANKSQNGQNRKGAQKNSTTGVRGVYFRKDTNKYCGQVTTWTNSGRKTYSKSFSTLEEASFYVEELRLSLMSHYIPIGSGGWEDAEPL